MDALPMTPGALAEMIALIEAGTISGKIGKELLPALLKGEAEGERALFSGQAEALLLLSGPGHRAWHVLSCSPQQPRLFPCPRRCSKLLHARNASLPGRCARHTHKRPPLLPAPFSPPGAGGVAKLVEAKGLVQISDPAALEAMVDAVLAANPKQLEQYRGGKTKLQGYFVGQLMKESKGRANPTELNRILMEKLNAGMQ